MTTCLRDEVLAAVFAGEDRPAAREHLGRCLGCAARYRALERDVALAAGVLREAPPLAIGGRDRAPAWRWAPAVAALAGLLLVAVQLAPSRDAPAPTVDELHAAAGEVSVALFGLAEGTAPALRVPTEHFAGAALEGGWPCRDREGLGSDCSEF